MAHRSDVFRQTRIVQRSEVVRGCLRAANELHGTVGFQQQLGRTQLAVVVVAHGMAVRTGIMDDDIVADVDFRQHSVNGKLIVVFAQAAHNVVLMITGQVFLTADGNVMVRAVSRASM